MSRRAGTEDGNGTEPMNDAARLGEDAPPTTRGAMLFDEEGCLYAVGSLIHFHPSLDNYFQWQGEDAHAVVSVGLLRKMVSASEQVRSGHRVTRETYTEAVEELLARAVRAQVLQAGVEMRLVHGYVPVLGGDLIIALVAPAKGIEAGRHKMAVATTVFVVVDPDGTETPIIASVLVPEASGGAEFGTKSSANSNCWEEEREPPVLQRAHPAKGKWGPSEVA